MPRSRSANSPVTPDPVELQRRINEDKWIKIHTERIVVLENNKRKRFQESVEECKPLREENGKMSNERARLMKAMKKNDSKIRTIRERAMLQYQPELRTERAKLKGRKNTIKERYVLQLMCAAREQLNKALPLKVAEAVAQSQPEPHVEPPSI